MVVFDNVHFVVANKAAGWLSVPSRQGAEDARPCLGTHLQEQLKQRLWPVHRLDQEVSGLVLFAKDAPAHKAANLWFENHTVQKIYEALTEGQPPNEAHQHWESNLLRGKRRAYESPAGKPSVTDARYEGMQEHHLGWRLKPRTGRPHQLRVHLSANGFPIVGDALYGSTRSYEPHAIALRAVMLDFSSCSDAASLGLPPMLRVTGLLQS